VENQITQQAIYVGAVLTVACFASGKKFSHTFTAADVGTINYFCLVHPWMIGEINGRNSPQRTPSHSNGVYASPTISSSTQRPILNATPHELTSINEARNNQAIAAEVNVVNQTVQTTSLNSNVSVRQITCHLNLLALVSVHQVILVQTSFSLTLQLLR